MPRAGGLHDRGIISGSGLDRLSRMRVQTPYLLGAEEMSLKEEKWPGSILVKHNIPKSLYLSIPISHGYAFEETFENPILDSSLADPFSTLFIPTSNGKRILN